MSTYAGEWGAVSASNSDEDKDITAANVGGRFLDGDEWPVWQFLLGVKEPMIKVWHVKRGAYHKSNTESKPNPKSTKK